MFLDNVHPVENTLAECFGSVRTQLFDIEDRKQVTLLQFYDIAEEFGLLLGRTF